MVTALIFIECLLLLLLSYLMITKNNILCIVISNIISAVIVFMYCICQAPDIAITEAVIGVATSTVLYSLALLYINKLPTNSTQNLSYSIDIRQRIFIFILCFLLSLMLIYIIQNFPKLPVLDKTIKNISNMYISRARTDFHFSSIVTAVVAGYRAFDTMFENVVIFTACYGFYTLLTMDKNEDEKEKNNTNIKNIN